MIEIAKKYNDSGFYCLPVKLDKSPDIAKWRNGEVKITDFTNAKGIGIMCGKESGGLECFDFDNKFGDAKKIISDFLGINEVDELYKDKKFPIESTQSGGYHLLFRCELNEGNQKLASRSGKDKRPVALIETRGIGGYFVAPPTEGYKEIRNDITKVPTITKIERDLLFSAARSFNEYVNPLETPQQVNGDSDRVGDRYNDDFDAIPEMEAALSRGGWVKLNTYQWRRPGKDKGISATIGKVAPNVFYCFTSSGSPFIEEKGYKPFQVVGLLDYNGDFKAFAKDLAQRYNVEKPNYTKPIEEKTELKKDFETILSKAYIDLSVPPVKPPIIMEIKNNYGNMGRLFTLGNFSALTGKAKSKKSFLTSLLITAALKHGLIQNKFKGCLPESKSTVLRFDTEQSEYDAYVTSKRSITLLGEDVDGYGTFDLREYSPMERCEIIEYAINKYKDTLGYVVIDGIADLAKAINDEEEATRVTGLLMRWTKIYNIHITTVIHQNKNNNFATGHLGSSVMKKAEVLIAVDKYEDDYTKSKVSCDMIRGAADFDDFEFKIESDGLPYIIDPFDTKPQF